ncbi:6,7-dimethyl-8-ribityllumazine synthase [Candidatus Uhrbacteria bacterium RIFCSPLOWO2_12_FULL_46_10]|uniref:6,7-dimethyl-8-ribityllumazine synthase n=1 Tax=Candidatus Uhrbacteria bacterium RIFCSPLOWO2_01_FULL_47_25 TaxID=1802402 RepID=A0A1F7UX23_9BACT|nr:MAG: 6,7-dimethyl-8-ribityllumazine synthase [Parcubacteria group bacterium GW2011_GWA2_46_9]OGL60777.1 MAG: 6,7-dimethyl-8-ribityllumazine synthase [Candidatus Uhrbacteria bacterium RIFCSPHIGHO2_01_FULL_46_23]OGL70079.1 MAG: 6,7-dimethyl-8-ribityllumazine synthase [Candidatus Uhrbacteria bacterium RIFCSPHIGHO2_02_FULL_47_29]OGL75971.1 MAG: 6,7-dimethyl-8-ribityllumazine synthase [Candidatus Uhrbacteria bacterium RIFCSPHIGHO2_12_FULL_46_13]OGL82840.1 MAG: 6,7-dimethyl-8-ribityllumazine synth
MQRAVKKITVSSKSRSLKLAVVVADFNEEITKGLLKGALKAIHDSGLERKQVRVYHVAGSFEVAELAMRLAKTKRLEAIVCLGAIIKGETTHDQHLASAVTHGLMQIGLDTGVAIGLGVITANNMVQARARCGADKYNRGYAAVVAAILLATQKI